MENNSFSPLEAGMKASSQNKTNNTTNIINDKVQNTHAEDTLATIASFLFWVSTIGYSMIFIAGIVMRIRATTLKDCIDCSKYSWIGLILIIASIIFYLINIVAWAKLKVTVNISRNLFAIKGLMLEDKEKNSPKQEKPNAE